jgi:hypothetical protein
LDSGSFFKSFGECRYFRKGSFFGYPEGGSEKRLIIVPIIIIQVQIEKVQGQMQDCRSTMAGILPLSGIGLRFFWISFEGQIPHIKY